MPDTPSSTLIPEHVFISYSTKDMHIADDIASKLVGAGINIWLDRNNLKLGITDWISSISDGLHQSIAVVLIATPNSKTSPYVKAEIEEATRLGCPILPVWIPDSSWNDSIADEMMLFQYVEYRHDSSNWFRVLESRIDEIAESRIPHHLLVPHLPQHLPKHMLSVEISRREHILFYCRAYDDISSLLATIYVHYLHKRFAPGTYEKQWVLVQTSSSTNPKRQAHYLRIVGSWRWFVSICDRKNQLTLDTFYGTPLADYGLTPLTRWRIMKVSQLAPLGIVGANIQDLMPELFTVRNAYSDRARQVVGRKTMIAYEYANIERNNSYREQLIRFLVYAGLNVINITIKLMIRLFSIMLYHSKSSELPPKNVPLLRRFIFPVGKHKTQNQYYEVTNVEDANPESRDDEFHFIVHDEHHQFRIAHKRALVFRDWRPIVTVAPG